MARELILKLSEDVGQLLVAGAHLAPSSSELAKDRDGLAKLAQQVGAKAPAIVKLAEAADKTTKAGAGAVASELMNLMQMAAQVRAAQAQAAPLEGTAQPLEACPPIGTPCNAKDLDDLYAALVEKGQGRLEVIERHIEGETIADLRLVEALVFAMGDSWIGETITDKAIPKLGRAIVAPIRARLDLKKGRSVDGRRLRALVAIEKEGAKQLLEQAVSEGSVELREAAMDAIADHVPGQPEFEKHALEAIRKEKSADIRRAAVRALAGSSSNEALELLLEAIDKSNTMRPASEALAASKHPEAAHRLLAKLQEAIAVKKPKAAKGATDKDKEKAKAEVERQRAVVCALLGALSSHQLPAIASAALELLEDYGAPAAWAVVNSADRAQLERIADAIEGDDAAVQQAAAEAAFRLGNDVAFKRLSPLFKAKDREKKSGQSRIAAILGRLHGDNRRLTDAWLSFFLGVIEHDPPAVAAQVIPTLGQARDKRALQTLMRIVGEGKGDVVTAAIAALGEIGDPIALDCMIARLSEKDVRGWTIRHAILSLNDPSSVDKVRTVYAKLKDPNHYNNWVIRSLLQSLEARFPGR
jgi:hypothetical protein